MAAILKVVLYTLSIASSLLLILVIMMQQTKSGGGLGAVAGGMTENVFGASATSVLTKVTTWLAVIFLLSTLFLGTVIGHTGKGSTSVAEKIQATQQTAPATPAAAPATPAATPAKPAPAPAK